MKEKNNNGYQELENEKIISVDALEKVTGGTPGGPTSHADDSLDKIPGKKDKNLDDLYD
ncbi:MAG: hypothetical protein Q4F43_09250 [Eubacteriales bacterium]|nr:hypothetical protein [Eubacteriales bacterium]